MLINENISMPYMKSLATCLNRMVHEGYSNDFVVNGHSLGCNDNSCSYQPQEIQVINYYRFEGESDPADNVILYVIETNDGRKGTLLDAYGTYNDDSISMFMKDVEDISKKNKSIAQ